MQETETTFEAAARAVITGDIDALRIMLRQHPELASARSARAHRATLLHYVAANGVEDERQMTPPNAVEVAQLLLEAGADADATADFYGGGPGSTPLVGLVSSCHPDRAGLQAELVRTFCRYGARVNGLADNDEPMATALAFMYPAAAQALAACGARLDHIIFAAAVGRLDLVREFLNADGSLKPLPRRQRILWFLIAEEPQDIAAQALIYACLGGHNEVAGFLLDRGVDVNAHPLRNETALHLAAWRGQIDTVKMLVARGALITCRDDRWGGSPVGWAVEAGHAAIRDYLLQHCEPDIPDAVEFGLTERVRSLLDENPELVNAPAGKGAPLRIAAYCGRVELVRLLLERGADPGLCNDQGRTALSYAEERGYDEIALILRQYDRARDSDRLRQ